MSSENLTISPKDQKKIINFIQETEENEEAEDLGLDSSNNTDIDETDEDVAKDVLEKAKQDITEIVNRRIRNGDQCIVEVQKDGKRYGNMDNMILSWDEIHKKLGQGYIHLTAHWRDSRKKHTASQGKQLGPYIDFVGDLKKEDETNKKEKDTTMTDTLQIMAKAQAEAEERAERKATQTISLMKEVLTSRNESKGDNTLEFMKMMMDMQTKAEERTQALIEKMNEKNEKLAERQEKQIEKILADNSKTIEKVLETISTITEKEEKEPLDALAIQAMIDKAKKEGREEAERLADMIEAKAEKLASKNNPDKKEESILDKTISSFLPMAPTILGKLMSAPSHPMPMSNTQAIQNAPQRTIQSPAKVNARPQLPPPSKTVVNAQTQQKRGGMATVLPIPVKKVEENSNSAKIQQELDDKRQAVMKKNILDVTIPLILEGLISEKGSLETANKIRNELSMKGIKASEASKIVSLKEVNDLADSNGLTDLAKEKGQEGELKLWLATLHEELSKASL